MFTANWKRLVFLPGVQLSQPGERGHRSQSIVMHQTIPLEKNRGIISINLKNYGEDKMRNYIGFFTVFLSGYSNI
jgi:hypothetical protein